VKINWFLFRAAFAIAGLAAYGFFAARHESAYRRAFSPAPYIIVPGILPLIYPRAAYAVVKAPRSAKEKSL
jgi:hypothetical protein